MPVRLLCIGDIHLGRRVRARAEGVDDRAADPIGAWERFVALAVGDKPDAVVLTGDVVDGGSDYFRAYGALEAGARRLAEAGVPIIAVAGNHDHEVFPRLARSIEGFTLLGEGGVWREDALVRDGRTLAYFRGLSFNQRHLRDNPFDSYRFESRDDAPVVGVLHTEVDAADGVYLPTARGDFRGRGALCWLLGHVHVPGLVADNPPVLYCGSPQGLDITETGAHGAWRVTIDGASVKAEIASLHGVRFESVEAALDGATEADGFAEAVHATLEETAARVRDTLGPARAVVCRLRAVGRTQLHGKVREFGVEDLVRDIGGVRFAVESVVDATRPDIDLDVLAAHTDPAGLLAVRLIALRDGNDEETARRLIDEGRAVWRKIDDKAIYRALNEETPASPDDETVRAWLLAAGLDALEALLATRIAS